MTEDYQKLSDEELVSLQKSLIDEYWELREDLTICDEQLDRISDEMDKRKL